MNSYPRVLSVIFFAFLLFFFSCSNDEPQGYSVDHRLVFDFADFDSPPVSRLSVYLALESDVHLASSMKVINEETGLVWNCSNTRLKKIENSNKDKWAGYPRFVPAVNSDFPKGRYMVYYEDKAERDLEKSFYLKYPDELSSCRAGDFPEKISVPVTKKVAVYSNEDVLLYFGDENSHWKVSEDIIAEYKNAWCKRTCYCMSGNSIICLMPPVELGNKEYVNEKKLKQEEGSSVEINKADQADEAAVANAAETNIEKTSEEE